MVSAQCLTMHQTKGMETESHCYMHANKSHVHELHDHVCAPHLLTKEKKNDKNCTMMKRLT